jgi:uncharacterized protein (TIGR02391 family)
MLDYYSLKSRVKAVLLRQWQQIDIATDPMVWSWLSHSFYTEGVENNPNLHQALEQGKLWLETSEAWNGDIHLGSIGLLCYLLKNTQKDDCAQAANEIIDRVRNLKEKGISKFSRLNDPFWIFGIIKGSGDHFPKELRQWLQTFCVGNALPGNWRRCFLFAASAYELNAKISSISIDPMELQTYDIFSALWFAEQYPDLLDTKIREGMWEAFEILYEGINLDAFETDEEVLFPASPIDISMLHEALVFQTKKINPNTLFNNMPWHPELRLASESLFIKGEYVNAVFEAAKLFIDSVKNKAGHPADKNGKALDGYLLMQKVFLSKPPILKFNSLSNETDWNEQNGLGRIATGVVTALRNPKGHLPASYISLDPYEALEQLVTISFLMKKLDRAKC